ncbi:hypothetical protein IU469_22300 [Nocardia puris]|uniref:hypothetical protein n=1 Tax=Nocardia puris TaxID=208602 RepID=UPI00189450DD|nr:hypothetical protein [Nocardia puris]MBF6368432.1 hypothetical protein [Nocardia puris]
MPDNDNTHPLFHDDADQLEMIAAILDTFPGQAGNPELQVPIHPQVRRAWAAQMIRRGIVLVPALMEELPVAVGGHPEAGWLQPHQWLKRAQYERAQAAAAESGSTPEQQKRQAEDMLRAIQPSLADRIAALTDPEQRAAMAAELEQKIPEAIDRVRAAEEHLARARSRAKEQSNG